MARLRVAVVGARRARQGVGPFVARDLRAAGAEIVAFTCTTPASCDQAREQIERFADARPRAYLELGALLADEQVDALAICSPHAAHAAALEQALDAGLHALCEKPLVWGDDFAARSAELVARFAERGLVLFENCQWPHTLPTFEALHPGALAAPPTRFRMLLQPAARGLGMLADSLPHPLSLLQRLAPADPPRIEDVAFEARGPDALDVLFSYVADAGRIAVEISLRRTDTHPRRTRLELDGRGAEREVAPDDYAQRLRDGERSVALEDPMSALMAEFVACARADGDPRAAARGREIAARAGLLERLVEVWRERREP